MDWMDGWMDGWDGLDTISDSQARRRRHEKA